MVGTQAKTGTLRTWLDLAEGILDWTDWQKQAAATAKLTYLTIDTTGVCDLLCPGMCYYHPDINTRQPSAPLSALEQGIADAHRELEMENLVFAGKEPLRQMDRLAHLARFAAALPGRQFGIGLVTNGRAIEPHWSTLDALVHDSALSFIDVSLDSGFADQHDAIRGVPGTFAKAMGALQRGVVAWPQLRMSTASVLRHDNAAGLLALVRTLAPINPRFFITPLQPPPFTTTPPLAWPEIRDFLRQLRELLQGELCGAGVEVMVSLLGVYLHDATRDGLLAWGQLQEDAQGQAYVEEDIGGNRLQTHLQVLPETGWRIGRILYTGAYLPNTHFLQDPHPERFAVGYVQQESLPTLFRRAHDQQSILANMTRSRLHHACRARPCWQFCFGGWSAAEHSLVGGAALDQAPTLCPKSAEELFPTTSTLAQTP